MLPDARDEAPAPAPDDFFDELLLIITCQPMVLVVAVLMGSGLASLARRGAVPDPRPIASTLRPGRPTRAVEAGTWGEGVRGQTRDRSTGRADARASG